MARIQPDFQKIKETLDTTEAEFIKQAKTLFGTVTDELEQTVDKIIRTGEVGEFELPGRKRYLNLFEAFLWTLWREGAVSAESEIAKKREKFSLDITPDPVIPEGALEWLDGWTKEFGEDYYGDLTEYVVDALKVSLAEGLSTGDTMGVLSKILQGDGYNSARLETIARTNATTAFNQGRFDFFRGDSDFIPALKYLAILDDRVTAICQSRHGKIFMQNDPSLAENTPPLHYNCRSILSGVIKYEWEEMQEPGWVDPLAEVGKDGEYLLPNATLAQQLDHSGLEKVADGFGNIKIKK